MPNTVKCIRYKFVHMHTMTRRREGVGVLLHLFLSSTRCEWLTSRPGRFCPGNDLQYRLDGRQSGHTDGMDVSGRDKCLPLAGFQPRIVHFVRLITVQTQLRRLRDIQYFYTHRTCKLRCNKRHFTQTVQICLCSYHL